MLPGETLTAVLLVQNPTRVAVIIDPEVRIADGARAGITVTLDESTKNAAAMTIPAGGSVTVPANVKQVAPLSSTTTVVTTVGYAGTGITGSTIATLSVKTGTPPTAVPAALTISESGDTALIDTQAADLYFTVQNTSAATQEITTAILTFPRFLHAEVLDDSKAPAPSSTDQTGSLKVALPTSLSSGDGATVHLHVSAPKGLQPGNALVVFSISYRNPASDTSGYVTGSHKIGLSVFGENAVTGAFGTALAPALFVVPGLLFVLVTWFLWWRVYPKRSSLDFSLPSMLTASTVLAILGVLFALPFPYLYRAIFHRDYVALYGFVDIGWMCLLGIATGAVVWAVAVAVRGLIRRYRFEQGDDAPSVLRKITRGRRDLSAVENAQYTDGANSGRVFLLRSSATSALVCPPIVTVAPSSDDDYALSFQKLLIDGSNRELYRLVTRQGAAARPEYRTTAVINAVREVELSKLSAFAHGRIVDLPPDR